LTGRIESHDDPAILVFQVYDYLSGLKYRAGRLLGEPLVQVNHFNEIFLGIKKEPLENERLLK